MDDWPGSETAGEAGATLDTNFEAFLGGVPGTLHSQLFIVDRNGPLSNMNFTIAETGFVAKSQSFGKSLAFFRG